MHHGAPNRCLGEQGPVGEGHQSLGSLQGLSGDWRDWGTEGHSDSDWSPLHLWRAWRRRWRVGVETGWVEALGEGYEREWVSWGSLGECVPGWGR